MSQRIIESPAVSKKILFKVSLCSLQIPTAEISNFIEELEKDKRFHPSVIGIILLLFMLSVAFFISHMESITYFDSVYACFITYSTIGFGDIDIYVSLFFVMVHMYLLF